MHELILTSTSPRRKQILEERGYQFRIFPIEVSEILNENLNLPDQISDCAKQKVMAVVQSGKLTESQDILLLGADTEVVFEGEFLRKPKDKPHAISILNKLSGQVHDVITGFCLFDLTTKRLIMGHDITRVFFKRLTPDAIQSYVESGDPMDKAGAYGIQGEARNFVEKFEGSYDNVVGLPIEKIEQVIEENGWQLSKNI